MSHLREELRALLEEEEQPEHELRHRIMDALVKPVQAPLRMSFEEFLEWMDEDTLAEWVNGEVIMTSPASIKHQELGGFLYEVIHAYVRIHQLGKVLQPPVQMRLSDSSREPDLIFVGREKVKKLRKTYLDGPADLVVEIISPESMGRDRGEKFYEYEVAGVPEYWLLDPRNQRAEFYQLSAQGQYHLMAANDEGIYHARQLTGFWLRLEWLWQETLPNSEEVLLEVAGDAYAAYLIERLQKRGYLKSK